MTRVLVVTNDFPPRQGGIQTFVIELLRRLPVDDVAVLTSRQAGSAAFDRSLPFEVERLPYYPITPTPDVARHAAAMARAHGSTSAWFGAAAPLGLLAPQLRRAGVARVVASTHGHEIGWAALPGARVLLRRIAVGADVVTCLGEYQRGRLAPLLGDVTSLELLTPGVDVTAFRPDADGSSVRSRHGLVGRPVIVCVSRLVARKGQDALIQALPVVQRAVPDVALLLVGAGRHGDVLRRLAERLGVADAVVFTGPVPGAELPAHYAAGDVFAMPCRTRRGGLDVEGLGIVYLEASASGLPVIAGDSGGAPDAVLSGRTGFVVDGRDIDGLAERLVGLLTDASLAASMGRAGRSWVEERWQWSVLASRLAGWLA